MFKHLIPILVVTVCSVMTVTVTAAAVVEPTPTTPTLGATARETAPRTSDAAAQPAPGPATTPSAATLETYAAPEAAVPAAAAAAWRGEVRRAANVRREPTTRAAVVRELAPGTPVTVTRWVLGDVIEPDNPTWAEVAPGELVYAMSLKPLALPPAVARLDRAGAGKWIDVDVTRQIVTAYEGAQPVHTTYASMGRPGWETPLGTWRIQRRVADETMDGATLAGQGPDGTGATYRVEHVRWTQYFTADGSAIHENSWRDPATFGIPGSHGCVGLAPAEASWFWTWASPGTQLVVHV